MNRIAKRSFKKAIALLICLIIMSSFFVPVFAWYFNRSSTKVQVNSGIVGSYFEQGNGTADTPYVIARPIQLYYFAWLQDLGYFDGDNEESTTSDKRFYFTLGADIDMSENTDYSVLPPVGTPDHPFVGVFDGKYHYAPTDDNGNPVTDPFDPNNTKEGTYHVISNLKVSNDNLSNIPTNGQENQQYIGLFGVIGSMSDPAVTGTVKNFGLYNITVETEDPTDNKTIIGIVAGYCNGVLEGVGVSDSKIKVKNGVEPTQVTTYQVDPETGDSTSASVTPGMISFSLVGFSDKTYQAYNISPIAGGNEFGGSIAMQTIYNKIITAKSQSTTTKYSYYKVKTVDIDEDGNITETYSGEKTVDLHADGIGEYFDLEEYQAVDENGYAYESYSAVERYSSSTGLVIGDGNGNFLAVDSSGTIYNTTDEDEATVWTMGTSNGANTSGTTSLYTRVGNNTRYLRQSNGTLSLGNSQTWNIAVSGSTYEDFRIYNSNYYITYSNGSWRTVNSSTIVKAIRKASGSEVTQYTYLNGAYTTQKSQKVITITHTRYDAYLIQDESGNYLVGTTAGNISNTTNSGSATAWRFSNGANGGTFSIQSDDEVTYYLYNNNGTLQISSTNSTNWTISNGQISNGGYYLVYLDGAWKLWQETTYYSIENGNGTYLNFANNNLTSGNSATTRWHVASNKIYTYNGTTKTYIYNNNGTLATTTNVNTASTWTVNNTTHTMSTGGYYLVYLDGAWKLWQETEYYAINNGNGTYLNLNGNNITSGNSATTKWHIVDGKIYAYNGTTKTYLYNNNGTLATTTTSGTASTWETANGHITTGGFYLAFIDGAWKLWENTKYYSINNGSGTYLNLNNGNIAGGNSATTRWHFSSGDSGGQIYTFVNDTKTYLRDNNGTLETTTTQGNATTWTVDSNNHNIKSSNNRYLCYNDGAWGLTEETEYYVFNDGNNHYLNLSNGNIAGGASSTRWYKDNNNKIYAYNGTTKTYLYINNGALATTTTAGSATAWTIDNANHNITSGGYYLCYNDGAWMVTQEAGYYLINDGSGHYLNLSGGDVADGTSQTATRWFKDNNNKLYAYNNGTKTYLYNNNGVLTTTTTVGSATTWTIANNNIKAGNYYLAYQNGWFLTIETTYSLISDGSGNYFNLTANGFEIGTSSNATRWHNDSGKLYTYLGGTKTYLVNNSGVLSSTTTEGSATTWTITNSSITNGAYYLVYQNSWLLTDETGYYTISDGNGNYLNLTANGYENGTSSTAVGWHFTNGASGGKIYTYVNGARTYIYNNNGTLSTTTNVNTASTWTISNGQISNNGYSIIYSDVWRLTNVSSYYTLSDEAGHYLNLTASGIETGTSSNATDWQITNTSSGKIYTYINGTATYLYNNNGTLATTTNSNTATTWTIDNTNKNIKNNGYFLTYDGSSWVITNNVSYYKIHDNNNHYMNLTYSNSRALTSVGTSANATVWKFSNKSSGGYISAEVNNTTYYLNYVDGNMVPGTTQSTTWTVSGNTIYCTNSGTNYNIFCDGSCWTIVRNGLNSYYLVSSGNNYLSCSTSEIENETVRSYARKWEFTSSGSTNRYYISTQINGTNYWLRGYRSGSMWSGYTYYMETTTTQNSRTEVRTDNNKTYLNLRTSSNNRYIYYSNGWTTTNSSQTLTVANISSSTRNAVKVVNDVQYDLVAQYASGTYDMTNSISSNEYDLTIGVTNNNYNLTANAPYTEYNLTANSTSTSYSLTANTSSTDYNVTANTVRSDYDITANFVSANYDLTNATESTTTVWKNTVTTTETIDVVSKDTYIPLTNNEDGTVSMKNTGYIVGGSNYYDPSSYSGDIRVSYYAMNQLSASTNNSNEGAVFNDSRLEVLTQTYLSNGLKRIYDTHNANNSSVSTAMSAYTKNANTTSVSALGLEKYTEARNQLADTLDGQSQVYGLHFMDAQININNLARIDKATINGSTYYNYSVPQDCIDFNLSVKGSINFFAGTYFPSNDSFFSFHRILRSEGEIVAIKEISKIYGVPSDTSKSYIYWYAGESQPTLPTGYVMLFDTDWIKSPTMVDNAMYYYEIPVNPGEYALGSVNGGLGAYLIYLDIGASAQSLSDGTTLETAIKGIDFVTHDSLSSNSIAATLQAIDQSTPSSAVIILKTRFQGEIQFTIQEVTVDNAQVIRIGYALSDDSAKDYVLWTKANSSVEVVDDTDSP